MLLCLHYCSFKRESMRNSRLATDLLKRYYQCWMDVKARLAQSVERLTLNQVVVGSSPTVGDPFILPRLFNILLLLALNSSTLSLFCDRLN